VKVGVVVVVVVVKNVLVGVVVVAKNERDAMCASKRCCFVHLVCAECSIYVVEEN
jgi:hypothetical protein